MKIIVFTSPEYIANESEIILKLFLGGVDYIHIRKPNSQIGDIRRLIADIPQNYHSKLRLHEHYSLLNDFDLGGVQLNSKNDYMDINSISKTKSCHSIEEIKNINDYEYVTLSPIFNSISKKDYFSKFKFDEIRNKIKNKKVVALGGVEPKYFKVLKECNF